MIKKIIIENFRSIKRIEINLNKMNAFIGPNNAGKSNIMKALDLVLGSYYPTIRSFDEKDFYNYEKTNAIKIDTIFDTPLTHNSNVYGFRLTYDGVDCEYYAIDTAGNICTYYPGGRQIRVSNEMKGEVTLMYLGLDRQAVQQIKASQWTLYGKLLKHVESQISAGAKDSFRNDIEQSYSSNIHPNLQLLEDILKQHVKEQTGLDLYLRLSIMDPIETIKNLRPYLKEVTSSKEFDAEDMGAGTQSALAIAIARAYAEIVKKPLVMAIEEPELYLHPHGCRNFYNLLEELTDKGVQIIYTTHDRCFVNISDFQSIHLLRKESDETKVYSGMGKTITFEEEIKLASKFDENINEIFFANRVILVEGPADRIACQIALEKLGLKINKEGISVTECGSNTAIRPIAEVLQYFQIPTYILMDEDPGNQQTASIILDLKTLLGNDFVILQSPNLEGLFGLSKKPNKKESLEIFPKWVSINTPPLIYESLKQKLSY